MDRNSKIAILEAVSDGQLLPEDFKPVTGYTFIEIDNKPGYYTCNGKRFNPDQFKEFCDKLEQRNKRRESIGLMTDGLFIIKSSIPIKRSKPSVKPIQPDPAPIPEPVEVTEDIPAIIETGAQESPAIKPEIVKTAKPVTFSARGETLEQMQERMQREHDQWQKAKRRDARNESLMSFINDKISGYE